MKLELLEDLTPINHHLGKNGKHWKYKNLSIILTTFTGIHSNGIDTYEVLTQEDGDLIYHASYNKVQQLVLEQQVSKEEAKQLYPEFYI